MENKNILAIGSILSDFSMEAASKFGVFLQEMQDDQSEKEEQDAPTSEYDNNDSIGDYDVTYNELCQLLDNIKEKWEAVEEEHKLFNASYHRDLLYLYDRIRLDMHYLSGCPDVHNEWLDKLLELKYEIRNLL